MEETDAYMIARGLGEGEARFRVVWESHLSIFEARAPLTDGQSGCTAWHVSAISIPASVTRQALLSQSLARPRRSRKRPEVRIPLQLHGDTCAAKRVLAMSLQMSHSNHPASTNATHINAKPLTSSLIPFLRHRALRAPHFQAASVPVS